MNTTIAKHLLCLLLMALYFGTNAQDKLAMNTVQFPKLDTEIKSDTIQHHKNDVVIPSAARSFKVSPNHTTNAIYVVARNIIEGTYILQIFNLDGERVYNEVSQLTRNHYKIIDTSTLPEGSYYLVIKSGKIKYKEKISI